MEEYFGDLDEHIGEVSLVVGNSKEVVEMTSEEPTQAEGTTTVAITKCSYTGACKTMRWMYLQA